MCVIPFNLAFPKIIISLTPFRNENAAAFQYFIDTEYQVNKELDRESVSKKKLHSFSTKHSVQNYCSVLRYQVSYTIFT